MKSKEEFLRAYDKYAKSIVRHIYFRVNDWDVAEDLTQETFFKTWRYVVEGESEIKNFKTFFYTVARNLIIDHYRSRSKQSISLDDVKESDVAVPASQVEEVGISFDMDTVKSKLKYLKKEYKEILLYRYVDDLRVKEIAKITSKSESNISVIIHRGLKELKNRIKNV